MTATAPPISTIPVGVYEGNGQPNFGEQAPKYEGAPPPYMQSPQQPQTRIYSTTNAQPTIVTPMAQPNVLVVGNQPRYVVVDRECIIEAQRARRRRMLFIMIFFLVFMPLCGCIIFIPIYWD